MSARSLTALGAATASLLSLSAVLFAGPASAAPDCAASVDLAVKAAATAQAAGADDQAAADAQKIYDARDSAKAASAAAVKAHAAAEVKLADAKAAGKPQAKIDELTADVAAALVVKNDTAKALVAAEKAVTKFEGNKGSGRIVELRLIAGKTDAAALLKISVDLRLAAGVACKDSTTPTPTVSPTVSTPVVTDPPQVIVVPNTDDGVDTGSW